MAQQLADEPRRGIFWPNKLHTRLVWGFVVLVCSLGLLVQMFPVTASSYRFRPGKDVLGDIRQVNVSLIMYASDNDDLYPGTSKWMDVIQPYAKSEVILHSLAVLPSRNAAPTRSDPFGIAFRKSLELANCDRIPAPEQVAVIFDSSKLSRNAAGGLNLLPDPPRHLGENGRYNLVGFVDGHVSQVPRPVVIVR